MMEKLYRMHNSFIWNYTSAIFLFYMIIIANYTFFSLLKINVMNSCSMSFLLCYPKWSLVARQAMLQPSGSPNKFLRYQNYRFINSAKMSVVYVIRTLTIGSFLFGLSMGAPSFYWTQYNFINTFIWQNTSVSPHVPISATHFSPNYSSFFIHPFRIIQLSRCWKKILSNIVYEYDVE